MKVNERSRRCPPFLFWLWVIACFLQALAACQRSHRNQSHSLVSSSSIDQGKRLAAVYCASCHMLPDPSLLDAKSWEAGVLPEMGPRLGIFSFYHQSYPSSRRDHNLAKGFYPATPLVTPEQWEQLIDYYSATSPDSLSGQIRPRPLREDLSLFQPEIPSFAYPNPTTCFIKIDTSGPQRSILLSDVNKDMLIRFDKTLHPIDSVSTHGTVVNMAFQDTRFLACNIGVINPTNGKFGKGQFLRATGDGKLQQDSSHLFDQLQRPVQISPVDLNGDGLTDYLICEFGFLTGALSWMENKGNNRYERHVLRAVPGAIKAYVQDYNHDGLPDLWVLFAQGDEGIFLFTNHGHGQFSQTEILRFPAVYGSSYFELADFNQDGFPDIVYTCGDNADYSSVLKPYHGVYIFVNDGQNHFSQKYFYPINGCYKAIARDFDGDGDLDLAVISYFADYQRQPEEGFVYLENKGNYDFEPHTLAAAKMGRWLCMDAEDLDGDGKIDLILGNCAIGPVMMKHGVDWKKGPPFLVLRNVGK